MKKFCSIFFFLCFFSAHAIDSGDVVLHASGGWNQNLKAVQGRVESAYSFFNDFSIGPAFEFNKYFYALGMGVTWHLEPFEVLAHTGPLYWRSTGQKQTAWQVSVHANYLIALTTHWQLLGTAGVNLPDRYFRGVPIGLGMRYWF